MKIFTEKSLAKYVDEKVQRIRDWDNYVRDIDRLTSENYKLYDRIEKLERLVDEICRKHSEDHEVCDAIRRAGAISVAK